MTEVEFIDIFKGNLKSLMDEVGYNQQELAQEAKIDQSTISKYLNGTRMPSVRALNNISIALNCTINELIGNSMDYIW